MLRRSLSTIRETLLRTTAAGVAATTASARRRAGQGRAPPNGRDAGGCLIGEAWHRLPCSHRPLAIV